jgi:hypothetical protein
MKPRRAKKPKTPILPIDIALPEHEALEDGAMFVVLRTLDELESFWKANREMFHYAAEGVLQEGIAQEYLNECEWVFGPSKTAVVKAVFRWDQMGIKCEWYDWAGDNPREHAYWFDDRDGYRQSQIAENAWSKADEAAYQTDCQKHSPETYRGWWILTNLPNNCSYHEWFSGYDFPEITDPHLPVATVVKILQEHNFDDWKECDVGEIRFCDQQGVDESIAHWRDEQRAGREYYGIENEVG